MPHFLDIPFVVMPTLYVRIIQYIQYLDIYVDEVVVYKELAELQETGTPVDNKDIINTVRKHSRGPKNRCHSCHVDKGEGVLACPVCTGS